VLSRVALPAVNENWVETPFILSNERLTKIKSKKVLNLGRAVPSLLAY
jgi:hypothetical protein